MGSKKTRLLLFGILHGLALLAALITLLIVFIWDNRNSEEYSEQIQMASKIFYLLLPIVSLFFFFLGTDFFRYTNGFLKVLFIILGFIFCVGLLFFPFALSLSEKGVSQQMALTSLYYTVTMIVFYMYSLGKGWRRDINFPFAIIFLAFSYVLALLTIFYTKPVLITLACLLGAWIIGAIICHHFDIEFARDWLLDEETDEMLIPRRNGKTVTSSLTYNQNNNDNSDSVETDAPQRKTDNALFIRTINSRVNSVVGTGAKYLHEHKRAGEITQCVFNTSIIESLRKIYVTADVIYKIDMYYYKDYDYAKSLAETDMREFEAEIEEDLKNRLQNAIGRLQEEYDNYDGEWELEFRLNSNITR